MIVLPINDVELECFENDSGAMFNGTREVALLAPPSLDELRQLWSNFQFELRQSLKQLFRMPVAVVRERLGMLGHSEAALDQHSKLCWALLPQNNSHAKGLARITQVAALSAAVQTGLIPDTGKVQQKFNGQGSLSGFLAARPLPEQERFVDSLFSGFHDLDDVLRLGQGKVLGLRQIDGEIAGAKSVESFLAKLARDASGSAKLAIAHKLRAGAIRSHAPIWFADFLAREGVWLLPLQYAEGATSHYPAWLQPVQLWMTLPRRLAPFADQLLRDHFAGDSKKSLAGVVHTAVKLGLCSTIWQASGPCAGPLVAYKRAALAETGKSSSQRSWMANRLWDAQVTYFGVAANEHPDAHAFVLGKRLVSVGRRPFEWVHHPNIRNTRLYAKIYGSIPAAFPDSLQNWASELEQLLPVFGVEAIEAKVHALNLWLLFLAGLPDPPRSFEDVVRSIHIHSPSRAPAPDFRRFLLEHISAGAQGARSAMRTLRQAWQLASDQEGFGSRLANPIDPSDTPYPEPTRHPRTVRSALDPRVAAIIARENLADDMAFARGQGRGKMLNWRRVRCPETNRQIEIFFPAAPVLVNTIMKTGMRGMQARWLDSGEGDEHTLDVADLTYRKNVNEFAERGRREGFLRLCEIFRGGRENVLGMWINCGKSGPFEVPWIDDSVVGPIQKLIALQANFFPLTRPVPIELEANFLSEYRKPKGVSFPLARDPNYKLGYPISASILRNYWYALLHHCQPIIDRELGFHYPLFDADGKSLFDIHSLRVTIVTTLLENGVPPSVLMILLGHGCIAMSLYYEDVPASKVRMELDAALNQARRALDEDGVLPDQIADQFANESVTLRSEEDFTGRSLLLQHRKTPSSWDIFAHGICPGGQCETGGESYGQGRFKPVWRPRACSACRYRITGPAFLNGLLHRANTLLWEIKTSMDREVNLYAKIESEEDLGRPVGHLHSNVRREVDLRDKLFFEWSAELNIIKAAELALKEKPVSDRDDGGAQELQGSVAGKIRVSMRETHRFELAQRLIVESAQVQDFLDLPPDVKMYRDCVLARIAEANDLTEWFRTVDADSASEASNMFADLLIAQQRSVAEFDALIEGVDLLRDQPEFSAVFTPLQALAASVPETVKIGL